MDDSELPIEETPNAIEVSLGGSKGGGSSVISLIVE